MSTSTNPVIDAVFDFWFESELPSEALLGIILSKLEDYAQVNRLPLLQVPENIRITDPNLKAQPLYEIFSPGKPYKITLGDNLLGLAINGSYIGWNKSYLPEIEKVFSAIFETKRISKINRMGMRYVDFFDFNIFNDCKVKINIAEEAKSSEKMFLKLESLMFGHVETVLVISNDTSVIQDNVLKQGSIIDIVTSITDATILESVFKDITDFFNQVDLMHTVNKDEFKKVISDELCKQLNL